MSMLRPILRRPQRLILLGALLGLGACTGPWHAEIWPSEGLTRERVALNLEAIHRQTCVHGAKDLGSAPVETRAGMLVNSGYHCLDANGNPNGGY